MKRSGALFLIAVFLLLASGCGGPTSVVKRFLKSSSEGDFATAKFCTTGSMLKLSEIGEQAMGAAGMDPKALSEKMVGPSYDDIKDEIKYETISRKGDTAEVQVTAKGESVTFILTKVSGSWLISDLKLPGVGSLGSMIDMMGGMPEMGK